MPSFINVFQVFFKTDDSYIITTNELIKSPASPPKLSYFVFERLRIDLYSGQPKRSFSFCCQG